MVHDTPLSQDASTHQIWNSSLKEYKIYARDTIILKSRSEVKVTLTLKWYVTPCHPKIYLHTKVGIPISKNMRYAPDSMQLLETRSEVKFKITVTQLWYATLRQSKMHPHTEFEIPSSNNIRDMLRTRFF